MLAAELIDEETPLAPVDPRASAEAVEWFRERVPVTADEWERMSERARRGAFRVAGVARLDIVTEVWRAIDSAVAAGTDFREFQRTVGASLAREWGRPNAGRVATIFRTNVQTAYAAGRYAVATNHDTMRVRPWWRFDAILDGRTTPICDPRDGLIKPASDSWWSTNYPPLHFQCRSGVTTLTDEQAAAEGWGRNPAFVEPPAQATFGLTPSPDSWAPDSSDYPGEVWSAWSDHNA